MAPKGSIRRYHAKRDRAVRIIAAVTAGLVAVGLMSEVVHRSWSSSTHDADVVAHERAGVVYLHPLVALVGQLVQTQSAAVRGDSVDAGTLRQRVATMGVADGTVGAELGTTQRYTDLRIAIDAALAGGDTGRAAYQTYTDVVALAVDLAHRAGDTSHLRQDQGVDSYNVMDAALNQLFTAMVSAGRAADLATLAGSSQLSGEDAIRAAVARYDVAAAGEAVTSGLNKSVDATASAELGTAIAPQLDAFRAAVAGFAPPTVLAQLAGNVDAATLAKAAHDVFEAAVPLDHKLLYSLDELLETRQDGVTGQRRFLVLATAGTIVAGLILLGLAVLGAFRRRPAGDGAPGPDDPTAGALPPIGAGLLAASLAPRPGHPVEAESGGTLTLIRGGLVGTGERGRHGERGDAR